MAIFTVSNLISGIRGTVGGTTFSANASGPYVRPWARSTNPRTARQSLHRAQFAAWASSWQSLTGAQRTDWDNYAADPAQELVNSLGEPYFASGFNWYVRINTHLLGAGESPRDDAPTLTRPAAPSSAVANLFTSASGKTSQIRFSAGDPTLSLNKAVFCLIVPSTSRNIVTLNRPLMVIEPPVFLSSQWRVLIQSELEAVFGTLLEGQKGFTTVFNQDAHGQRSAPLTDSDVLGT